MAKSDKRVKITLECTECKRRNYITMKSKINDRERLEMKKYCSHDRRHTCVVRQGPEDKAVSRLMSLKPLKQKNPEVVFGVMGCMVGVRDPKPLREKFPFVDAFLAPSDPSALVKLLQARGVQQETGRDDADACG